MNHQQSVISGNYYDKYHSTNPIERYLVNRYKNSLIKLVKSIPVKRIFEVGSGEGNIIEILFTIQDFEFILGSDIDNSLLSHNSIKFPTTNWILNKAENLPLKKDSVDLLIACEVLEHIESPEKFFLECSRIRVKYYIFSVPNEPLWRILNICRFKYLRYLGNTPGHVNHWSKRGINKLVSRFLNVRKIFITQPWIFILAEPKQ